MYVAALCAGYMLYYWFKDLDPGDRAIPGLKGASNYKPIDSKKIPFNISVAPSCTVFVENVSHLSVIQYNYKNWASVQCVFTVDIKFCLALSFSVA